MKTAMLIPDCSPMCSDKAGGGWQHTPDCPYAHPGRFVSEIRTVLGDTRPVVRHYEDGSFECPWCCAAVIFPKRECENPACDSSKYWTPERLQERRDREAHRLEDEARRKRDHEAAMQRIAEDKALREIWQKEKVDECIRRGCCLLCLFQPGWDRVKFVKHRKPCPKRRR